MKYNALMGISVLPALFIMPATADVISARTVITANTTYTDLTASNIASTVANNGGVFYMQDVPDVLLTFDGTTLFSGNSLNNGGMGGAIGNGWLSSTTGTGFTPGGKIVFNGPTTFTENSTNNKNGGGAIFNYGDGTTDAPDIEFKSAATFNKNTVTDSMNSVYIGGGAINHRGGAIVFDDAATFSENSSASKGGAIMTAGDILFGGATQFNDNTATTSGGAMAILGGNTTFAHDATFSNNTAGSGAALYIDQSADTVAFNGAANFIGNTGTGIVLNNSSDATITFANGAVFQNNTNPLNGSLVNAGNISVSGGNLIFENNTGSNGGGLKNSGTVITETTGNISFTSNHTTSSAGAFDNGGTATLAASNVSFVGNVSDAGYAGAIFNAGDVSILGKNNVFRGNAANDSGTVKSGGGAIHNRGNLDTANLIIGTSSSTNVFDSNTSAAYGGAIVSRAFDGTGQDSDITINGTTSFINNRATLDGGAIWNNATAANGSTGNANIVFNGDTTFTNNTSGGRGGALYNNDTITFNGAATFSGNTANGALNDIYNDGTVNLNGNTSIGGGIDGTGILNIANGATLNIGTSTLTQGSVNLDGTMLATLRGGASQINVSTENGFTGSGVLKLALTQAGTYNIFGNQTFDNIDVSSSVYDLTWNGGALTASLKSVADIASENNLTQDTANLISGISSTPSARLNDISVIMQTQLSSGAASDIATVEDAARAINPGKSSVSQSVGTSVQNAIATIVSGRVNAPGIGRSGGDFDVAPGGIWAQGVYNKSKQNDTFNGYTRGVAVGIDGTVNNSWTAGLGYMYTDSDLDAISRDIDVDSSTVFVYAQYQPTNWYMNATLNYTMSDYSEHGNVFGARVSSDYDVDIFGASVATGYEFMGGITPELALRYMHMDGTDYTNSLGIRNEIDGSDYLTASLGTRYDFDVVLNNGLVLQPQMRYAIKYDLISDDNDISVLIPGAPGYVLNGERLSRVAGELGVGVGMMYRGVNMSLNYDIEFREDYTSQTGRVKFRYEF